jgi:membrane protease YdiL (CAAX protease family)
MGLWAAAVIDGIAFGAVHGSWVILPVLAFFGVVLCLVYEWTGTLFATIAMHSVNNMVAFGQAAKHGWTPALAACGTVLALCMLMPRLLPAGPAAASA